MSHTTMLNRRHLLQMAVAAAGNLGLRGLATGQEKAEAQAKGPPTRFQIACMTLPYSQYPLARALSGIRAAGFQYVAWGTTHKEAGEAKGAPVMAADARPEAAKELGKRCRDLGLTPLMMFSTIYPEDPKGL